MPKSIPQLLQDLEREGLRVFLDRGTIRFQGSETALTGESFAEARRRKDELRPFLEMQAYRPVALPIGSREETGPTPLSLTQRAAVENEIAGRAGSNRYLRLLIEGNLDRGRLEGALASVVNAHSILRTRFILDEEPWSQLETKHSCTGLDWLDLSRLPDDARWPTAISYIAEHESFTANLMAGDVLRAALIRLTPRSYVLSLSVHGACADQRSMQLLGAAVSATYAKDVRSNENGSSVPYADFANWESQFLCSSEAQGWMRNCHYRFSQYQRLDLGGGLQPPKVPRFGALPFEPGPERSLAIVQWSRRESVPVRAALMTAFNAALCNRLGRDRVASGVLIGGRLPATRRSIGPYGRIRPVETDLSGPISLSEASRYTAQSYADAADLLRPVGNETINELGLLSAVVSFVPVSPAVYARPATTSDDLKFRRARLPVPYVSPSQIHLTIREAPEGLSGIVVHALYALGAKDATKILQDMTCALDELIGYRGLTS